jgi:hypothetical protein
MSRSDTPASDDPLLDFCSEEDGTAAQAAARWRLPDRPRMPQWTLKTRVLKARVLDARRIPSWALKLKSELAGLPASEAMTGIAILSAVVFVGAFALTPRASGPPLQVEGRVFNDIDLASNGKPVATTGGTTIGAAVRRAGRKAAVSTPVAGTKAGAAAVSAPLAGWLTVAAPADFEIVENGQLIGSTAVPRIMLPVGRHNLVIGNAEFGYTESRIIDVAPGRTTTLKLEAPNGRANINARPWANVTVDGRSLGQTPLADVSLPVGRHEVVFQHPQFGERRQTIVVTANGVAHVGVDFGLKP